MSAAIVVLGCAIRFQGDELRGAAARRVKAAARAYAQLEGDERAKAIVIASGGRRWNGVVEADALRDALTHEGVPRDAVVRERCSMSTRDNAQFVARLLARRGEDEIALVTCDWHLSRAAALFRREGLRVHEHPALDTADVSIAERAYRWGRERVAAWKDGIG